MLDKAIRILNFDASVIKQKALISQHKAEIIDLERFSSSARIWMSGRVYREIKNRISGSNKEAPTFIGSGDFHHVSSILLEDVQQPFCLIIFDLHPDWETLPPKMACGSWVTRSLKNKNILKAVLLGVSSDDISTGNIQTGNISALKNDRLEIYPYSHAPTDVFFRRIHRNISVVSKNSVLHHKIHWSQLHKFNLAEFCESLFSRLPTNKVYISIDKDCLQKEYAATNWEEGLMSLDQLLLILRLIRQRLDIIGMDIVGDYSAVEINNPAKRIVSGIDHPKRSSAAGLSEQEVNTLNQTTNQKILNEVIG